MKLSAILPTPYQWPRAALVCVIVSLAACETLPEKEVSSSADSNLSTSQADNLLKQGNTQLDKRNYEPAMNNFNQILASSRARTEVKQNARTGKALIFLSPDRKWRDLDGARKLASGMRSSLKSRSSVEMKLLVSAVNRLVTAETDNAELQSRVSGAIVEANNLQAQIEGIGSEKTALNSEIEALNKRNGELNEALQQLRKLTFQ